MMLRFHCIRRFQYLSEMLTFSGSDTENRDIRKAYLNGKGCINYLMEHVPFMQCEDEPRIIELVKGS